MKTGTASSGHRSNQHQPLGGNPDSVFVKLTPPKPTSVFDTYWHFAAERQAIFFRRLAGTQAPWTQDAILQQYKFTNAYRASDRVSQFLINNVIYTGVERSLNDAIFRILLFKVFNKIDTWQRLERQMGDIAWASFDHDAYDTVLSSALHDGERIYSAAYIMPSGKVNGTIESTKHRFHLHLLDTMLTGGLGPQIARAASMKELYGLLLAYSGIGEFLAYQFVTDINYSELTNFSENEFVMPGPGARDGLRKCFESLGDLSEADLIRWVTERQELEFAARGIEFQDLWGRPLQLIDCQNLFCEVSKYARVAHPEVAGLSGRLRIKQQFRPSGDSQCRFGYPPKWKLQINRNNDATSGLLPWKAHASLPNHAS